MTALTKDRNTHAREGDLFFFGVAVCFLFFVGVIVMLNASGYATKGAAANGQICVGRAEALADNSSGSNADITVDVRSGEFKFANSASSDAITIAEIGDTCYIVDDHTVAKTVGTGTRSAAGKIVGVDSDGVWVRMGL